MQVNEHGCARYWQPLKDLGYADATERQAKTCLALSVEKLMAFLTTLTDLEKLEALRRDIKRGEDSGEGSTAKSVFAAARKRIAHSGTRDIVGDDFEADATHDA